MMIALIGSGEYLPPMEPVDLDLLRRLGKPARVVCLPTAAGKEGAERIGYWSRSGVEHFTRLGAECQALPVIDLPSANDPGHAHTIGEANFVYLSGGNPAYLYRSLAGTLVWEAIRSVLAGGGILAGCSAGAMVMGGKIIGFPISKPAFNLLPGAVVIPHFDEFPAGMLSLVRRLVGKRTPIVGIEANTALLYSGDHCEVLGSGGVTYWDTNAKQRFVHGHRFAWSHVEYH
jgi:cyanophycinase